MSVPAGAFSARVELPCRVFYGPDSVLEVSGIAVSIDTGSLLLAMPARIEGVPQPGEKVRLELSLPISSHNAAGPKARGKYLAVRARVAGVTEMLDGSRQIKFTFRKASFKDRMEGALPKAPKAASKAWRM